MTHDDAFGVGLLMVAIAGIALWMTLRRQRMSTLLNIDVLQALLQALRQVPPADGPCFTIKPKGSSMYYEFTPYDGEFQLGCSAFGDDEQAQFNRLRAVLRKQGIAASEVEEEEDGLTLPKLLIRLGAVDGNTTAAGVALAVISAVHSADDPALPVDVECISMARPASVKR